VIYYLKRLLFITPSLSTFNQSDLLMFEKNFDTIIKLCRWKQKCLLPFYLVSQLFFLLTHGRKLDYCIISFAGWWSIIPVLLFKFSKTKTVIILHGTECAAIDSLKYGNLRKKPLRYIIRTTLKHADIIAPVSQSLVKTKITFGIEVNEQHQGYKEFFPFLTTPYSVIHNGLDGTYWQNKPDNISREERFLAVISEGQFNLKGGDLIYGMAEKRPDLNFSVAGMERPTFCKSLSNIKFLGKLSPEDLKKQYHSHKFYLQLSSWEGFGLSLCEAMLCGCIPIGSNTNEIPKIISRHGYIINEKSITALEKAIYKAMTSKEFETLSNEKTKYINLNYSLSKREKKFINTLENID